MFYIEVKQDGPHYWAEATYRVGKAGKERRASDSDMTVQRALRRLLSRLRRNGHKGKPYAATVVQTGAVLRGKVPGPAFSRKATQPLLVASCFGGFE